jgi:hypothetical protein
MKSVSLRNSRKVEMEDLIEGETLWLGGKPGKIVSFSTMPARPYLTDIQVRMEEDGTEITANISDFVIGMYERDPTVGDWVQCLGYSDYWWYKKVGKITKILPGCLCTRYEVLLTGGTEAVISAYRFLRPDEIRKIEKNMERDGTLYLKDLTIGARVQDSYFKEVLGAVIALEEKRVKVRWDCGIYTWVRVHPWDRIYDLAKTPSETKAKGNKTDLDFCIYRFFAGGLQSLPEPLVFGSYGERMVAELLAPVLENMYGFSNERVTPSSPWTHGHPITIYPGENQHLTISENWIQVRDAINAANPHTWISFTVVASGNGYTYFYAQISLRPEHREPGLR